VGQRLGITFMAYSPLGRGFLTGSIRSSADLETKDFRRTHPRFQEDNLRANLGLVDHLRSLAEARSDTAAQLALAWVLQQPWDIVPIVATRSSKHFKDLEEHPGLGSGGLHEVSAPAAPLTGRPSAAWMTTHPLE